MSSSSGGTLIGVKGQRLCHRTCKDLEYVMVGNAKVTKFVSKSPSRIVFRSPSAAQAGGGAQTVVVRSSVYGDAEAPASLSYLGEGTAGVVNPSDIPLHGKKHVVIKGSNLGTGEEYRVLLAGVEAKVLSASARRIEVEAGDGHQYVKKNQLAMGESGIGGNVIIETLNNGKAYGMDTQINFQYNTECHIDRVDTKPGPVDGEATIRISGRHLGMGDEQILLNGKVADSGLTTRKRQGKDVHELTIRLHNSGQRLQQVMIDSPRTGQCSWTAQGGSDKADKY